MRRKADCFGLTEDSIPKLLRRVYGARYEGRPGEDLFDLFSRYKPRLQAQLNRETFEGINDHTNYGELFIKEVDKEIARLEHRRNYPVSRKFSDSPDDYGFRIYGPELLRLMIPSDSHSDRLLRYEASLERAFDRTLNQLERLQRRRKGEVVPAPISANVSLSQ